MAEKEASLVCKPEDESSRHPNPFSSMISKFTDQVLNFRFPPPPVKKDAVNVEKESIGAGDAAEDLKPEIVRFPDARTGTTTVPPVKLEAEVVDRDTNPVVLWQVYAIGGFFILRWVLGRWNERRANKKASNEESATPPPPPEANE